MSKTTVVGSAPIAFTTAGGTVLSIPLSALSFVDSNIQIDKPDGLSAIDKAELESWLKYLVKIETIKQGKKSAPNPAIAIEAVDSGEIGNSIQIEFKNFVSDPTAPLERNKSTFDAVVRYDKNYVLSYNSTSEIFIKKVLGTETTGGTQPGLVHIKDTDNPNNAKPTEAIYTLTGGSPSQKSSKPVDKDPSETAFTLEVIRNDSEGDLTKVIISNVSNKAQTFDLTVVWEKSVMGIKKDANFVGKFKEFSYLIKITKPKDANNNDIDYSIPDAGIVVLNGGSEKKRCSYSKSYSTH